jgi:PEP-CTERM motif-containing protein
MAGGSRVSFASSTAIAVFFLILSGGFSRAEATTILYDAALGTGPASQGWTSAGVPGASQTVAGGVLTLNTNLASSIYYGFGRTDQIFDSALGVQLSFTSKVLSESHSSNDRAGFSVIMLDTAHRGIELDFWTDRVFALEVGFTHAEELLFNTNAMMQYQLLLIGGNYQLSVTDGTVTYAMSGLMRDYSSNLSGVSPLAALIYPQSNFLFMGDDSSSGKASTSLASVMVNPLSATGAAPVPEPGTILLLASGLAVIAARRSRR